MNAREKFNLKFTIDGYLDKAANLTDTYHFFYKIKYTPTYTDVESSHVGTI